MRSSHHQCSWYLGVALLFLSLMCSAQQAMFLQQPHHHDFDFQLRGEVAYVYETRNPVLQQDAEWQYQVGKAEESFIFSFDEGNHLSRALVLRDNDRIDAQIELVYEGTGKGKRILRVFDGPALLEYSYNRSGQLAVIDNTYKDRLLSQTSFIYGRKGKALETVEVPEQSFYFERELNNGQAAYFQRIDSVDGLTFEATYRYDDRGWLIEEQRRFTDETKARITLHYTYKTDDRGNWVVRREHNQATGRFYVRQRTIIYRDELAALPQRKFPLGYWTCPSAGYFLEVEDNGNFSFLNLERNDLYQGIWRRSEGEYTFTVNSEDHLGAPYALRTGRGLKGTFTPGRLQLSIGNERHIEFVSEELLPLPERLQIAITYERWSKNRYSRTPALKKTTEIPADIAAAFDEVRAVGPNYFEACLVGQCGIIDRSGRVLVPFAYERVSMVGPDIYQVTLAGKQGLVDTLGQQLLPTHYDRIWVEPKLGKRIVGTRRNGERYFFDIDLQTFLPFEKDDLTGITANRRMIRQGRFVNLYDLNYNRLTADNSYSRIDALSYNRYLASGPDANRIIDETGKELFVFDGYLRVREGTFGYVSAYSATTRNFALFDINGKQITEPIYSELTFCTSKKRDEDVTCRILEQRSAVAQFKTPDGRSGYLTASGQEVR